eukprot:3370524-Heterocapsa_arctica.AAC.1
MEGVRGDARGPGSRTCTKPEACLADWAHGLGQKAPRNICRAHPLVAPFRRYKSANHESLDWTRMPEICKNKRLHNLDTDL